MTMTTTGRGVGLRALCLVSAVYDFALALPLLVAPGLVAQLFGTPPPVPVINAQLNGLFTLCLAVGYLWAAGRPEIQRGYLWIFNVLAKGLGAALFVIDHVMRGSPELFLLFALSDGTLAVVTLAMLRRRG